MSPTLTTTDFFLALAGGFLPSLVWLWFWLREDDEHPEPRGVLILTFFGGMGAVIVSLLAEFAVSEGFKKFLPDIPSTQALLFFLWAAIEEGSKLFFAWRTAIRKPCFDEPIDGLIYMITAALGFASLENIFFVIKATTDKGLLSGLITGNLRFIGATILHTFTSAIIGACLAFSFFHKEDRKKDMFGGLIIATILHFLFNYSIIRATGQGESNIIKTFIPLWLGTIILIFLFERVKKIKS